ncbi:hypothetical protein RJP21_03535 [Paenibacillus sp. VCA1]|uniref:hypothetical protein n=1 Tax=Paenibacillus sp. VCA1 TaxID=3039148 RepID=UPI002871A7CF|nr:hypothetical protein [Paenibacillus sp. VCA1]MDR9852674.1 hypothetical protein [Paenibacillus sp. VCA1]
MGRSKKNSLRKGIAPTKKKPLRTSAQTALSPQQIAVIGGLLSGFFVVESVIFNRSNELKVILTSNPITEYPVLGNKEREEEEEIALEYIASEPEFNPQLMAMLLNTAKHKR